VAMRRRMRPWGVRLVLTLLRVKVGATYAWGGRLMAFRIPEPVELARIEYWRKGSRARSPTKVAVGPGEDFLTPRLTISLELDFGWDMLTATTTANGDLFYSGLLMVGIRGTVFSTFPRLMLGVFFVLA